MLHMQSKEGGAQSHSEDLSEAQVAPAGGNGGHPSTGAAPQLMYLPAAGYAHHPHQQQQQGGQYGQAGQYA